MLLILYCLLGLFVTSIAGTDGTAEDIDSVPYLINNSPHWEQLGLNPALLERLRSFHKRYSVDPETLFQKERLLVYRPYPSSGIGNVLQGLLSYFMFALASDRLLFIDWYYTPGAFAWFEEPFPRFNIREAIHRGELQQETLDSWCVNGCDGCYISTSYFLFGLQHIIFSDWDANAGGYAACGNFNLMFPHRVLVVSTNVFFGAVIRGNPYYASMFNEMFGGVQEFSNLLIRILLKPGKQFSSELEATKQKMFRKHTIGLHVRNQYNFHDDLHDQAVWKCAAEAEQAFLARTNGNSSDVVFFVSTLYDETLKYITEASGSRAVWNKPPSGSQKYDEEHIHDALLDIWLLGSTDVTIFSALSTFSRLAQAISGRPGIHSSLNNEKQCHVAGNSEITTNVAASPGPCGSFPFRVWPLHDCPVSPAHDTPETNTTRSEHVKKSNSNGLKSYIFNDQFHRMGTIGFVSINLVFAFAKWGIKRPFWFVGVSAATVFIVMFHKTLVTYHFDEA